MLDSWNASIFSNIKQRLQDSAMKLVHAERNGEAFDSQLVIGVRESYVNLCSNSGDKLQIYRENFEKVISTFLFCLKKNRRKNRIKEISDDIENCIKKLESRKYF